jgi:hypothetical protein
VVESAPNRPEVPPLNCRPLITLEEVDVALGVVGQLASIPEFARGEACTEVLADDTNLFVRIEPGDPDDFEPDAQLMGVSGEPVSEVGDEAIWFGGEEAEDGGDVGALSVRQNTPLGVLHYRITLGRPDLDSAAQLEIAKTLALNALPRFPGVEVEEPPPRVIPPPEPVDISSHGYVENLLEKEADGEWTRGEGLVATLRLLVGEADPSEVLRHPDLLDIGSGVVGMAREYLEDGDDPTALSEIGRLLAVLVQQPTRSETVGVSSPFVGGDPTALSEIGRLPAVLVQQPTRSETVGVSSPFALATSQRLITPILLQTPEDECLPYYGQEDNCWRWVDIEPEKYGEGTYRLMGPQRGSGWESSHVNLLERAMIKTLAKLHDLGVPPPPMDLVMTPQPGLGMWIDGDPDGCTAGVTTGIQQFAAEREDLAEQAAAWLIAGCSLRSAHFPDGSVARDAWPNAGAWFLSDVVYPDAQLEQARTLPAALEEVETSRSMLDYNTPNWAFLEDVGSIGKALDLLKSPATGLGSFSGIDDLIHQYAEHLTAGKIADQGKPHGYTPPHRTESLSSPGKLFAEVTAFRALRIEVSVDGGEYACVSFPTYAHLVSWSPGSVGSDASWSQALPETLDGKAVFIVTSTVNGQFVIDVSDFVADPDDCEDDKNLDEGPDPLEAPCPIDCPPSRYFH